MNLTTTWSFAATDSIDGDSVGKAQILIDFGCLHDGYQIVPPGTSLESFTLKPEIWFFAPSPTDGAIWWEHDSEENARTVPDTLASRTGHAESERVLEASLRFQAAMIVMDHCSHQDMLAVIDNVSLANYTPRTPALPLVQKFLLVSKLHYAVRSTCDQFHVSEILFLPVVACIVNFN